MEQRNPQNGYMRPTSTAATPITQRDIVLRATLTIDSGVIDLESTPTWRRVKIHGVPVAPYVGSGSFGMEKFCEELEAENDEVEIPVAVRWPGWTTEVKTSYSEREIEASSVTF